jgi:hypothetical protein
LYASFGGAARTSASEVQIKQILLLIRVKKKGNEKNEQIQ